MKQTGARRIRALDHPGHGAAHDKGDRCARRCKQQRITQQAQDVPAGIRLDEIGKRELAGTEAGVLGEGVVEQRRKRDEDEPERGGHASDEQHARQANDTDKSRKRGRGSRQTMIGNGQASTPGLEQITAP